MDFIFYICVFVFTVINYIYSINHKKKWHDKLFNLYMLFLIGILACRYGQGSDYFSYQHMFEECVTWQNVTNSNSHGEIGFRILCFLFRGKYELFVVALAVFDMLMLYRGIKKFSYNKWLSLCIFFPTGYMSFFYSSFRQGIVISVFLGYLLECIVNKKWKKYYSIVIVLTFIHTSAWVLALVPVILAIPQSLICILSAIVTVFGWLSMTMVGYMFWSKLPYFGEFIEYYVDSFEFVEIVFPALERIISALLIYLLYHYNKKKNISKYTKEFVNIYIFGLGIYFLVVGASVLVASRIMIYFKLLEIYIVPNLIQYSSRWKQVVNVMLLFIATFMLIKNINSYLQQAGYFSHVSVTEYPYISIFNEEEIWKYREKPKYIK